MSHVEFFVAGKPVPQGSLRGFNRGGKVILTSTSGANLKHWRDAIGYEARQHFTNLCPGPIGLTLEFFLPRPTSLAKKHVQPLSTKKPDIDKILRSVLDALTGIAYADDAQVAWVRMEKRIAAVGQQPGVAISVSWDGDP
jgi:Holliday junction resolvase RusA-like endonuclease